MYIVSVENKITLRTDGPHRVSGLAPTSILAIGGNFASGPPPAARTTSRNRPETARNRPKQARGARDPSYVYRDGAISDNTAGVRGTLHMFSVMAPLVVTRRGLPTQTRTSRRSKPLIFLLILIRNRYFFSPGRSWPLAPGRPGTRNR